MSKHNHLDRMFSLMRDHAPSKPLYSPRELRSMTEQKETARSDEYPSLPTPARNIILLSLMGTMLVGAALLRFTGRDVDATPSTPSLPVIAQRYSPITDINRQAPPAQSGATAPQTVGTQITASHSFPSDETAHRSAAAIHPSSIIQAQSRFANLPAVPQDRASLNTAESATTTDRPENTDHPAVSPDNTTQTFTATASTDDTATVSAPQENKPSPNDTDRHEEDDRNISGVHYLELTSDELKKLGIEVEGKGLKAVGENVFTITTHEEAIAAAKLGYDTAYRQWMLVTKLHIDTFSIASTFQPIPYTGHYSRIAPIFVLNQWRKAARDDGSILWYADKSPLLKEFIGNNTMGEEEMEYIYDVSTLNGKDTFARNDNRYPIVSRLVPIYIRIGDESVQGTEFRRGADICLWYYPTKEFMSAIPERYRIPLQRELDVITDVESYGCSTREVCELLTGERTFLDYCRKSSGAVAHMIVYPNPAHASASCRYELTEARKGQVTIHDVSGKFLRVLTEFQETPGNHEVRIDLEGIESGAYLVAIRTDQGEQTVQRILVQ